MAVRINGSLTDGLTGEHEHGPSGDKLRTTAPKDNGGTGAHFSPTDLLATSLGSCMVTIMALAAKKMDLVIDGTTFSVDKHMTAEAPRRVSKLAVAIHVPNELPDNQQEALAQAAKGCPVCRSLSPEIEIEVGFTFGKSEG